MVYDTPTLVANHVRAHYIIHFEIHLTLFLQYGFSIYMKQVPVTLNMPGTLHNNENVVFFFKQDEVVCVCIYCIGTSNKFSI